MMTEEHEVSFAGIAPAVLLSALYHGTRAVGLGLVHDTPNFGVEDARAVIARRRHPDYIWFDYVMGRPIKVKFNLVEDKVERADLYDRDAQTTVAAVVAKLRQGLERVG